jgi:amidase
MQGHELVGGVPEADLAVCGPLARSAEDLHLALDIMAGPADREALGWQLKLPAADFTELKDLRVVIWGNDEMAPVSKEIADRADQVGRILSDMGATVSSTARPDFTGVENNLNYRTLLNSVMSANLPRDQVKKIQERVDALDPGDFSEDAVSARSAVLSHRDWIRANFSREKLRNAWRLFFEDWDIVICPQMATAAFPHDHSSFKGRTITVDNLDQPYFSQLFWSGLVTNSYLPSTVFPTGLSKAGLPIGLQAISAPYRDHRTIEFARQITRQMGGFIAPAAYP